jgi:hypothetical protein
VTVFTVPSLVWHVLIVHGRVGCSELCFLTTHGVLADNHSRSSNNAARQQKFGYAASFVCVHVETSGQGSLAVSPSHTRLARWLDGGGGVGAY